MNNRRLFSENHRITPHGTTHLDVVYTNMTEKVDEFIDKVDKLLQTDEFGKHRIVGLDLEYTYSQENIAVVQLCLGTNVLVFHYSRFGFITNS